MSKYYFGQRVDVNKAWASTGSFQEPYRAWFSGYRFCCYEDNATALVFAKNLFGDRWIKVRYDLQDIRESALPPASVETLQQAITEIASLPHQ